MQGRRRDAHAYELLSGEYGCRGPNWYGVTPNGLLCTLTKHVTEHPDGTITVSPSILVDNGSGGQSWHGYLEHGVWREV